MHGGEADATGRGIRSVGFEHFHRYFGIAQFVLDGIAFVPRAADDADATQRLVAVHQVREVSASARESSITVAKTGLAGPKPVARKSLRASVTSAARVGGIIGERS